MGNKLLEVAIEIDRLVSNLGSITKDSPIHNKLQTIIQSCRVFPKTSERPALGLRPRWIVLEHRRDEIAEAINRYISHGSPQAIPFEWLKEYNEIILELNSSKPINAEVSDEKINADDIHLKLVHDYVSNIIKKGKPFDSSASGILDFLIEEGHITKDKKK